MNIVGRKNTHTQTPNSMDNNSNNKKHPKNCVQLNDFECKCKERKFRLKECRSRIS